MADGTEPQQSGGRSWEPIPEGDPFTATEALDLASGANPVLLVGTKKGVFFFKMDQSRRSWQLQGPAFLGHIVHHIVVDPRDRRTILMAIRTGHLGPTVFRSTDFGKSWQEARRPPAFRKAISGEIERSVDQVFYLKPGHATEPCVWYAGTSPEGLFRSEDDGDTWESVAGWNDHDMWSTWCPTEQSATPDGSPMFSILIDPRDKQHMYACTSSAGVFESTDQGGDWVPLNRGSVADFLPDPNPPWGQDPHCVEMHPLEPDVLYQ
ncbi:MAG: hypothetical protein O7E57_03555, partial [Gammaproteobacteria bacterium]|nr:hypothetical protein [Gammaproteobacteria bacterium]